jgi:hypothetical protein
LTFHVLSSKIAKKLSSSLCMDSDFTVVPHVERFLC